LSLIGLAFISVGEEKLKRIIFVMVSLAVGGLFGDAFIHLLPESFERIGSKLQASLFVLAGIFAFFVLEKFLLWRHQHVLESDHPIHPVGYMNLLADGAHNFIDGVIIGASYDVSLHVGIATTLAVIFHEIPHELGNFFVLLYAGFTKRKANAPSADGTSRRRVVARSGISTPASRNSASDGSSRRPLASAMLSGAVTAAPPRARRD